MNNEKIMKSSSLIDLILKIIQGFFIASGIICAAAIPLILVLGDSVTPNDTKITLDFLELQVTDASLLNVSGIKHAVVPILLLSVLMFAVGWYYVRVIRKILKPLKEGRPFERGISARIRKMAWATLISGVIFEIIKAAVLWFEVHMYDLTALFNNDVVTGYTYKMSVDLGFIIMTIVLFLLSYVFRCGEALQKESDETL